MSDFPSSKFERGKIFAKTGLKVGTNDAKYQLKSVNSRDQEEKNVSFIQRMRMTYIMNSRNFGVRH